MGAVTPGETLGTLYNIHVGSNKTKQHAEGHGLLVHKINKSKSNSRVVPMLLLTGSYYHYLMFIGIGI